LPFGCFSFLISLVYISQPSFFLSPTFSPTSALLKSIPSIVSFILLLLSSPNFFFTYSFAGLPKVSKLSSSFDLSSATFLSCLPSKASFPWATSFVYYIG